jgi:predicted RNA methylase
VLDIGAGTGKLTATLVEIGAEVVAVEPDPAMLTELRRALPAVRALPGVSEVTDMRTWVVEALCRKRLTRAPPAPQPTP